MLGVWKNILMAFVSCAHEFGMQEKISLSPPRMQNNPRQKTDPTVFIQRARSRVHIFGFGQSIYEIHRVIPRFVALTFRVMVCFSTNFATRQL